MNRLNCLWAGLVALLSVNVMGVAPADADPLTPAEIAYLDHLRQVFARTHDRVSFHSDGDLLAEGWYVCDKRAAGFVGVSATTMSPIVIQAAFIHLCP